MPYIVQSWYISVTKELTEVIRAVSPILRQGERWDTTIIETLTAFYGASCITNPGGAAKLQWNERKSTKYPIYIHLSQSWLKPIGTYHLRCFEISVGPSTSSGFWLWWPQSNISLWKSLHPYSHCRPGSFLRFNSRPIMYGAVGSLVLSGVLGSSTWVKFPLEPLDLIV